MIIVLLFYTVLGGDKVLIAGDALETIGHLGCSEITRLSACGLASTGVLQPAPASVKSCPTLPSRRDCLEPPADAGRGIDPSLDPSFSTNITVPTVGNSLIDDTSPTYRPKERGQEIWSSPLIPSPELEPPTFLHPTTTTPSSDGTVKQPAKRKATL